ncbi:MAG: hypothetical protein KatS3mg129_2605 [Leptospiraceae bacterium]|nr:MAG: hypothetical protein KatS3mg129_2605 [Leptospiraceae bacterium]
MLDAETKRRIDTARDILVGKVPDPKSQVEQITIALIYKFMDDMDKESIEMGGKPGFFIGEYEKYSWTNLMNPRLGGVERLNLYAEAIAKMSQNPHLPELFRNIFRNAYLPYRDAETLNLFLKTINEFTYDHSERLGDAFEYLLSVLGSQGDAGQFRTPRHIIDFMVEIVAPKKNEIILDPACGTAGFLISAYKYILRENTSEKYRTKNGNGIGDLLTTEERKKLLENFIGYDISPDMVRLSLVNMYLHGFVNPRIYEYDTLTSEDRWNEYADVILANPPFMSPKGGIRPHKRFSVQAKKSEVLFVDYIAEHLTPTGRAAVIVPEGIIFQSANAYKQLRKMLVENYLIAVISLPAGVFQPYSGVKTSILVMDKALSKKIDSILFLKIENDGYDLGAQRRPIDKNDLPNALKVLKEFIDKAKNKKLEEFKPEEKPCSALLVKKEKLAENGEYNLTGDRYRIIEKRKHQKWPMVRLGEVFIEIKNGKNVQQFDEVGQYRVSRIQTISDGTFDLSKTKWTDDIVDENDFLKEGDILLSHINSIEHLGKSAIFKNISEKVVHGINLIRFRPNTSLLNPYFASYIFKSNYFIKQVKSFAQKAVNQASIKTSDLKSIQIPLPPLEVQKEIVAEIEGYQKIIDGCKQVIENWKPDIETYLEEELKNYLTEHPEKKEELANGWPMVKLGEVCELIRGITYSKEDEVEENGYPVLRANNISLDGTLNLDEVKQISKKINLNENKKLKKDDIFICLASGSKEHIGKVAFINNDIDYYFGGFMGAIRVLNNYILKPKYLFLNLRNSRFNNYLRTQISGVNINNLNSKILFDFSIPLPPLEVQQHIVEKIEAERKIIDSLREMIKTYEEKIKKVIDKVWGEE